MKYLIVLLFMLQSCKKDHNVITYVLQMGVGDVVITDGDLVTDFNGCPEGWSKTRDAKEKTRYTIWTNAKGSHVRIEYNGKKVAEGDKFAAFTTP